jgi:hypothetical protein
MYVERGDLTIRNKVEVQSDRFLEDKSKTDRKSSIKTLNELSFDAGELLCIVETRENNSSDSLFGTFTYEMHRNEYMGISFETIKTIEVKIKCRASYRSLYEVESNMVLIDTKMAELLEMYTNMGM